MFRKFILPLVAAGAMVGGLSISSASAAPYAVGGSGAYITVHSTGNYHKHRPHKVCTPITKMKKVWTRHGWDWKRVVVGQKCRWVRW